MFVVYKGDSESPNSITFLLYYYPSYSLLQQALLSVYNKTDLVYFAKGLHDAGVRLLGSGGMAKKIRDAGIIIEYTLFLFQLSIFLVTTMEKGKYQTSPKPQKC